MMKKIAIFLISIFLILGLLACSDINGGEISYKDITKIPGANISLSIYSADEIFSSSAKTLLPSSLNGTSLNYYLFYINTATSTSTSDYSYYGKIDLTYSSSTLATAAVDFPASIYRFALFATEADFSAPNYSSVKNSACLVGYSTADLYSTKSVVFYLNSNSLSSGGSVDISLSSSWAFPSNWDLSDSSNAVVSIGIYDLATGNPVSIGGSNINPHYLSYSAAGEISNTIHLSNYTFGNAEITPGTYSFVVKFINYVTEKTFEYSDTIMILANQTTTAAIDVPNVINTEPLAPSDFSVAYTDPSDNDVEYYLADFSWSDNSNNETEFEIQIADISCGYSNIAGNSASLLIPDLSSDYNWELSTSNSAYSANNITTYDSDSYNEYINYYYTYFGTSDYDPESFSLIRNNTQAKFYFQLGNRYVARIRAVNDVGSSAWAYAVFGDGSCASINRYRISYSEENIVNVSYASQNESGVSVSTPENENWLGWYIGTVSYDDEGNLTDTNKYPMTDGISCDGYTGHENLYLVGAYTTGSTTSGYEWEDYDVVLYGVTDSASAVYFDDLASSDNKCENGIVVAVSKSGAAGLKFILSADAMNRGYDKVTLNIACTRDLSTNIVSVLWDTTLSQSIWQIPVSDWAVGCYFATFIAEKDGVSYRFLVVINLTA
ncbi:hypothetical protein [Treponema sp.]|uniref:hypothetical protein n=1 Tax=Treponema sp. TaxID=166 RepID=UPI00388FD4F7